MTRLKIASTVVGLLLLSAAEAAQAQATPGEIVAAELQNFRGNWKVVAAFVNGQPDDRRFGAQLTIIDDLMQMQTALGGMSTARISLQPSLLPRAIDISWLDGPFQGEKFYGIYRFDGQRLYVCASRTGVTRPKKFESLPDRVESLVTFERVP
ncbi:MAG TPA: TIGR03067 domain-containing protein [Pirellulales bacterium]|nr:TIGR03067 domain-containing protein [Pirellulales bacterium]